MILDYFRRATLYQVVDPAAARRWFAIWVLANDEGAEPSWQSSGTGRMSRPTGNGPRRRNGRRRRIPAKAGAGTSGRRRSGGLGPERYREEFGRIEEKELFPWLREQGGGAPQEVYQRLVDPRGGGRRRRRATTLIDRLAADAPGNPGMWFDAAPGLPEEEGMAAIEALLEWRPTLPASWPDNLPRLFVHERCRQVIWCLSNFNRMSIGDSKAPMRDPGGLVPLHGAGRSWATWAAGRWRRRGRGVLNAPRRHGEHGEGK